MEEKEVGKIEKSDGGSVDICTKQEIYTYTCPPGLKATIRYIYLYPLVHFKWNVYIDDTPASEFGELDWSKIDPQIADLFDFSCAIKLKGGQTLRILLTSTEDGQPYNFSLRGTLYFDE